MAARRRKGGLEKYYDRIVSGTLERGYDREFAEAILRRYKASENMAFRKATRRACPPRLCEFLNTLPIAPDADTCKMPTYR